MEQGRGQGPSAKERAGLYLDICAGVPEFLVTPLLMRPVRLLSHGRFEEPVAPGVLCRPIRRIYASIHQGTFERNLYSQI